MKPLSKNRLKLLHKLNQKKYRDSENLFIISGLRAVTTALKNTHSAIVEAVYSADKTAMAKAVFEKHKHNIPQFSLSQKEFSKLADEKTAQGICLIVKKPATRFALQKISGSYLLFLDRINDPGNLGTIIRSAAWFGFNIILLSSHSADPFQPKVVRASAGSLLQVTILEQVEADQLIKIKNELGYKVFAAVVNDGQDIAQCPFAEKTILMMGSEAFGLNAQYASLYDKRISITRKGMGESLNLANAASIFMYQAMNSEQ